MFRYLSLAGMTLLLLQSTADLSVAQQPEVAKGKILARSYDFKEAGKKMEYSLYVPTKYDKEKAFPLIVALHGLGSSARRIIRYPGFTSHAEKHGYLVVAPTGYNSRGWYGARGKGGGRGEDPENLGELSEKDVMNVLALVRKEFNINDKRIYLMGHSMGGGGTWHLGATYPDIWAGLGPIAPASPRNMAGLDKITHIPVIVIQGDQDRLVYGARRWVARMKELKMDHQYIEIEGGGHVDVAYKHFPELFAFFDAHPKGAVKPISKPEPTPEPVKPTTTPAVEEPGQYAHRLVFNTGTGSNVEYYLHIPDGYKESEKSWPLILFLHGAGSVGEDLAKIKRNGLARTLASRADHPVKDFIVVSPQSQRRGWSTRILNGLLNHVIKTYQVDTQRVYLTGLSMGGYGSWSMAAAYPERFAAVVPICGGGNPATAEKIKGIPIWVFHGEKDTVVPFSQSERMVKALEEVGGKVKFTRYPEAGHDAWSETYRNPRLYEWLLQQKLADKPAEKK
jgi:predicted peptidase